ncbi:hypothetical protein ACGFNY_41140, partial [Streptomyces chartreusis]|uniref:hypothetical protein n=1 Tax=Streptomyces chartreusis TaxID=1969 RepID=UPI0037113635
MAVVLAVFVASPNPAGAQGNLSAPATGSATDPSSNRSDSDGLIRTHSCTADGHQAKNLATGPSELGRVLEGAGVLGWSSGKVAAGQPDDEVVGDPA